MSEKHIRHTRRQFMGLTGAAFFWPATLGASQLEALGGQAFGTTWRLAVAENAGAADVVSDIREVFALIDQQMSPWRDDSNISQFNRSKAGIFEVPDDMAHVTKTALQVARNSDGFFDPTVGPLVSRWGFGPIEGSVQSDWNAISLRDNGLRKSAGGATLDLCGIAKGWALDRAVALVRDAGIERALFDLGGELSAVGKHPSGRDWQVAVEHPWSQAKAPIVLRLPAGKSVATSGIRGQNYEFDDRLYSHIIDPVSGAPAESKLRSVSVMSAEATLADGWATALFAAGETSGPVLARDLGIDALFLVEKDDRIHVETTGQMEVYLL